MRFWLTSALSVFILGLAYVAAGEMPELIAKLSDKDTAVRRTAAQELAEMGPDAKAALPALRRAVSLDKDLFVRRFAIQALSKIGPEAKDVKETVSTLALAARDEKKEVALAAAEALGHLGSPAIDALMSLLKDPGRDIHVRKKAAISLGQIGPAARGAVPVLTQLLSMQGKAPKGAKALDDTDIRVDAATALGKVAKKDDKGAIDALTMVSEGKQKNKELQKVAKAALSEINGMKPKKKK